MSQSTTRRIVFVARSFTGESLRSALAITKLADVVLFGICEEPTVAGIFHDVVSVADVSDSSQLLAAAQELKRKHGPLDRIVTTYETLLAPVAQTAETLGLHGMSVATVRRALEKSSLKATLEQAGVNTPRSQILSSGSQAKKFVAEVGYPIVLKPLDGSGGLATWTIRDAQELALALELAQPTADRPLLAEEYVTGEELCIDTIAIAGEPRFYSLCCYQPTILEALEDSSVQWRCVMPRDISEPRYAEFIEDGLKAVRALAVGNAMTHMEGFLLEDRRPCFIDATLRPAGARIAPMLAFAYDVDPYLVWARATLDGWFDGPWERKFAVGTVFVRGVGSGKIESVDGIESIERELGEMLMDLHAPVVGSLKAGTYTGDGYVTVRHRETRVVDEALDFVAETIRITYGDVQTESLRDGWRRRLDYKQLYKPAWENFARKGAKAQSSDLRPLAVQSRSSTPEV